MVILNSARDIPLGGRLGRSSIEVAMIVRLWHGRVPSEKARSYREFLNRRAIPDYRSVPGNLSVHVLSSTSRGWFITRL